MGEEETKEVLASSTLLSVPADIDAAKNIAGSLDRYMKHQGARTVTTEEISKVGGIDHVEAQRFLMAWALSHTDDCSIIGAHPLSVKVYPTILTYPEVTGHVTRQARRKYFDSKRK
ncbi:MAG: hypothetical protein QXW75_00590 [Thermoplasmatales archaeon]